MRTVGIVQARMHSTRFPGKVVAETVGKPILLHMIERLLRCEMLDAIVVAIPTSDYYALRDVVYGEERHEDVFLFCGSEEDVLSRVLGAARAYNADVVVELTADCPLIDPVLVDEVVTEYLYLTNIHALDLYSTTRDSLRDPTRPYYPRGMDVRVFYREVLEDIDKLTVGDHVAREHVSLYAWEHRHRFNVSNYHAPEQLCDDVRLTVDTPDDFRLVSTIFENFYPRNDFSLGEILAFLNHYPELRRINAHIEQKAVR